MCQLYPSKYLIVVRKSVRESRAPAARRDHYHAHADPEECNCKNGCKVLAELGLEAKPRTPSPLHAQHTMHAPASASASLQASASRHPAASASGSSDGGWTAEQAARSSVVARKAAGEKKKAVEAAAAARCTTADTTDQLCRPRSC